MKRIAIDKSISKSRLIYPLDSELVFYYIMMYFLSLVLPVVTVLIILSDNQHHRKPVPFFYFIFSCIDIWMLAGLYYTNKLYRMRGNSLKNYKDEVITIVNGYYPDIEFQSENPVLIRGEKEIGWLKMRSRIVTIILADDSI